VDGRAEPGHDRGETEASHRENALTTSLALRILFAAKNRQLCDPHHSSDSANRPILALRNSMTGGAYVGHLHELDQPGRYRGTRRRMASPLQQLE